MTDVPEQSWTWLDVVLLLLAPLSQIALLAGCWGWGYGFLNFALWAILFLGLRFLQGVMVVAGIVLLIWQRRTTVPPSPPRNFAVAFLIFVVALSWLLPWRDVFVWVQAHGRHQMEADLPPSALVEDCRSLLRQYGDAVAENGGVVAAEPPYLPTIARLNPSGVFIDWDGVHIEQAGGFIHYGYRYSQNPDGTQWKLIWNSEGEIEEVLKSGG